MTGACASFLKVCNDNLTCTVDTCDPVLGCVFTPVQSLCNSSNPCVLNSVCDPSKATDSSGCVSQRKVCGGPALFCSNMTCVDYTGCVSIPRDCGPPNATGNSSCTTYNCSEANKTCISVPAACFNFLGIVAGALAGGVIAAIVIAACILALCSAGGGALAVAHGFGGEHDAQVVNNPMYQPSGNQRCNPLNDL